MDSQTIVKYIVEAQGDFDLAAERAGLKRQDLFRALAGDETAPLNDQLRNVLMATVFNNIMEASFALKLRLHELSAGELSRAFGAMVASFAALSGQQAADAATTQYDASLAKEEVITKLQTYAKRKQQKTELESKASNE
jgi:hypothetical protein